MNNNHEIESKHVVKYLNMLNKLNELIFFTSVAFFCPKRECVLLVQNNKLLIICHLFKECVDLEFDFIPWVLLQSS